MLWCQKNISMLFLFPSFQHSFLTSHGLPLKTMSTVAQLPSYEMLLLWQQADHVIQVELNHPERHNTLNKVFWQYMSMCCWQVFGNWHDYNCGCQPHNFPRQCCVVIWPKSCSWKQWRVFSPAVCVYAKTLPTQILSKLLNYKIWVTNFKQAKILCTMRDYSITNSLRDWFLGVIYKPNLNKFLILISDLIFVHLIKISCLYKNRSSLSVGKVKKEVPKFTVIHVNHYMGAIYINITWFIIWMQLLVKCCLYKARQSLLRCLTNAVGVCILVEQNNQS